MTQPFDVLGYVHNLLQVLVLAVVENGVINDYAVDGVVGVGGQDGFFDFFFVDVAAGVLEATTQPNNSRQNPFPTCKERKEEREGILLVTGLLSPIRVHARRRICVCQKSDEMRFLAEGFEALVHFLEEAIGDVFGQYDLAAGCF